MRFAVEPLQLTRPISQVELYRNQTPATFNGRPGKPLPSAGRGLLANTENTRPLQRQRIYNPGQTITKRAQVKTAPALLKPASQISPAKTTLQTKPVHVSEHSRLAVRTQPKTCKERPDNTKKGGSGPSRTFVPWCSRKS